MFHAERRSNPRRDVELPVLVLQERCVEADRATISDVSWSGAFVSMAYPSIHGRRVRLLFRPNPRRPEVRFTGEVVRFTKKGFAMRFEALDAAAENVLREILGADAPMVMDEVTEKTLPLTGLAPAVNDTPPEIRTWSLRNTLRRWLKQAG
jgi:hypothetical protein